MTFNAKYSDASKKYKTERTKIETSHPYVASGHLDNLYYANQTDRFEWH
jgi:hypothetical protein